MTSPSKVTFEAFPAKLPRAGSAARATGGGAGQEYQATGRGRSMSAGRTRTAQAVASKTHSHSPAPVAHGKATTSARAHRAAAVAAAPEAGDGDGDGDGDVPRAVGVPLQPAALSKQQWFLPASAGAAAAPADPRPSDHDGMPFAYIEGSYRKAAPAPLVVPEGRPMTSQGPVSPGTAGGPAVDYLRYKPGARGPGRGASPSLGPTDRPPSTAHSQSRSPSPDAHGMSALLAPAAASSLSPLGSPTSPSAWGWGAAPGSPEQASRLGTAASGQRPRRAHALPALDEAPAPPNDPQAQMNHNQQDATVSGAHTIAMSREERAQLFLTESTPPKAAALAKVQAADKGKGKGNGKGGAGPLQVQSAASQNNSLTRRLEKLGFGGKGKGSGKVPEPSLLNKAAAAGAGLMGLGEIQALLSPEGLKH